MTFLDAMRTALKGGTQTGPTLSVLDCYGETHAIDENGYLMHDIEVSVALEDLLDWDRETFLEQISEEAGFPLLTEQEYHLVRIEAGELVLAVSGNVSEELTARDFNLNKSNYYQHEP